MTIPIDRLPAFTNVLKLSPDERREFINAVSKELTLSPYNLAICIQEESTWLPNVPLTEKGTERGGLIQITRSAGLPGFTAKGSCWAVREWSVSRQIREVIVPYFSRMPNRFIEKSTFQLYAYLFFGSKQLGNPDFRLGDKNSLDGFTRDVYRQNMGFDREGRGFFTWSDVSAVIEGLERRVPGQVDIEGNLYSNDGRPVNGKPGTTVNDKPGRGKMDTKAILGYMGKVDSEWRKISQTVNMRSVEYGAVGKSAIFDKFPYTPFYTDYRQWKSFYLTSSNYTVFISDDVYEQARVWHALSAKWWTTLDSDAPSLSGKKTGPLAEVPGPVPPLTGGLGDVGASIGGGAVTAVAVIGGAALLVGVVYSGGGSNGKKR